MSQSPVLDFNGQRSDEDTLFIFRHSAFVLTKSIVVAIILVIIMGLPALLGLDYVSSMWKGLLPVIGCVVGLVLILRNVFRWYFTVYIVTNQRIRYINQKGIFGSEVIDLPLSKIENISYNISGLIKSILKCGMITIQASAGDLIIRNVMHPEAIYNRLQDLVAKVTV